MSGRTLRSSFLALLVVATGWTACTLNPGVDLPKANVGPGAGGSAMGAAGHPAAAGGSSGANGGGGTSGTGAASTTGGAGGGGGSGGTVPGAAGAVENPGGEAGVAGDGGGDTAGSAGDSGVPIEPYANVTAVEPSGSDGDYTFNVSVESADIDCTQFANWWEVLSPEGALLYRRILDHSHTDENGSSDADAPGNTFTRSGGPVAIAAEDTVLVRAHMSTGGYNGMVMRGSVTGGFADAPDIGADFAVDVEDDDPQSTSCAF